jgi:predicted double-glycine peptidase
MKALVIVFLVVLIGVTPAFATVNDISNQTIDLMVVKENYADLGTVLKLSKQDKNEKISQINDELSNKTVMNLKMTNTKKSRIYKPITKTNTAGVVMQSTNYSCGPAALATVLNNLGINATEQELAILAGTDESGTTMYGLVQAAGAKGVNATGIRLSVNELKKNDIIALNINGIVHFSVINEIKYCGVKLADSSLGNFIISKKEFKKIYSGNALVINNSNWSVMNLSNLTESKTVINSSNLQLDDKIMKNNSMQSIKGKNWIEDAKKFTTTVTNTIYAKSKNVINAMPKDDPFRYKPSKTSGKLPFHA